MAVRVNEDIKQIMRTVGAEIYFLVYDTKDNHAYYSVRWRREYFPDFCFCSYDRLFLDQLGYKFSDRVFSQAVKELPKAEFAKGLHTRVEGCSQRGGPRDRSKTTGQELFKGQIGALHSVHFEREAAHLLPMEVLCKMLTCCMVHKVLPLKRPQYLSERLSVRENVERYVRDELRRKDTLKHFHSCRRTKDVASLSPAVHGKVGQRRTRLSAPLKFTRPEPIRLQRRGRWWEGTEQVLNIEYRREMKQKRGAGRPS
ncbi:hypothetical protein J6590_049209 [Homalodisca vitripennis]|nr:hypothetical protein J6590_049209 [Homalodisca vitripennis]